MTSVEHFNHKRPHQALDMQSPAQHYARSTRPDTGLPSVDYTFHDKTVIVTACGRICLKTKKMNLSNVVPQETGDTSALSFSSRRS
jgi:putative transposase